MVISKFLVKLSYYILFFVSTAANAFDGPSATPLDGPYLDLVLLQDSPSSLSLPFRKSPVHSLIQKQTPVRSQGGRGTCSIFATTAYIEFLLKEYKGAPDHLDLSEEWFTYVVDRKKTMYGSPASENLLMLFRHGMIPEKSWPYDPTHWIWGKGPHIKQHCGHLFNEQEQMSEEEQQKLQKQCLLVHRDPRLLDYSSDELASGGGPIFDPDFAKWKIQAQSFLQDHIDLFSSVVTLRSTMDVKKELLLGRPVLLSLPFFYGAWNHRAIAQVGIGKPDLEAFQRGEVGFPEMDSKDFELSMKKENLNAHSILLVGYDDDKEIVTKSVARDGTQREYRYLGVYYFKNSWGTQGFGSKMQIDGRTYPGYGMIVQEHARRFGMFVRLE